MRKWVKSPLIDLIPSVAVAALAYVLYGSSEAPAFMRWALTVGMAVTMLAWLVCIVVLQRLKNLPVVGAPNGLSPRALVNLQRVGWVFLLLAPVGVLPVVLGHVEPKAFGSSLQLGIASMICLAALRCIVVTVPAMRVLKGAERWVG